MGRSLVFKLGRSNMCLDMRMDSGGLTLERLEVDTRMSIGWGYKGIVTRFELKLRVRTDPRKLCKNSFFLSFISLFSFRLGPGLLYFFQSRG